MAFSITEIVPAQEIVIAYGTQFLSNGYVPKMLQVAQLDVIALHLKVAEVL